MSQRIIYTHENPDMDAIFSIWAVFRFISEFRNAIVRFVPANWNGEGFRESYDIAVDIGAGGLGIKGDMIDGRVQSCFSTLIRRYANKQERKLLRQLMTYVDAEDAHPSAAHYLLGDKIKAETNGEFEVSSSTRSVFHHTGLGMVFKSMKLYCGDNTDQLIHQVFIILDGYWQQADKRGVAQRLSRKAQKFGKDVAIIRDVGDYPVASVLFGQGFKFVIYVDGNAQGILANRKLGYHTNHDVFRKVVEMCGEIVALDPENMKSPTHWCFHKDGRISCRGSGKARVPTPSKVDVVDLAHAALTLV